MFSSQVHSSDEFCAMGNLEEENKTKNVGLTWNEQVKVYIYVLRKKIVVPDLWWSSRGGRRWGHRQTRRGWRCRAWAPEKGARLSWSWRSIGDNELSPWLCSAKKRRRRRRIEMLKLLWKIRRIDSFSAGERNHFQRLCVAWAQISVLIHLKIMPLQAWSFLKL